MLREGHADVFDRIEAIMNHIYALRSLIDDLSEEKRNDMKKRIASVLFDIDLRTEEEYIIEERLRKILNCR